MVVYGPLVKGNLPGNSSSKDSVSAFVYSGLTSIPSAVCHVRRSAGSAPFSCLRASSVHSGCNGCRL
jgi:hypothetical protein